MNMKKIGRFQCKPLFDLLCGTVQRTININNKE